MKFFLPWKAGVFIVTLLNCSEEKVRSKEKLVEKNRISRKNRKKGRIDSYLILRAEFSAGFISKFSALSSLNF